MMQDSHDAVLAHDAGFNLYYPHMINKRPALPARYRAAGARGFQIPPGLKK